MSKLSPPQATKLREHMATMPPAPDPDPDPEVNVTRFDESCDFEAWADDELEASDAAPPPWSRADLRAHAKAWAGGEPPHADLLEWTKVYMLEHWPGDAIGSGTIGGLAMAHAVGRELDILLEVVPRGGAGVLPLCELAGWPQHPEPGDEPLPPLR